MITGCPNHLWEWMITGLLLILRQKNILQARKRKIFDKKEEARFVLNKSMDAWNTHILPKYDKVNLMKIEDKVKLFKDTRVFN